MYDKVKARASLYSFLVDCRKGTSPAAAGLAHSSSPRRVPSIRRDELAAVLGVETSYYADLERGLLETPIPADLEDRIARALHLEGEYRQELATRLRDVYEVSEASQDDPAASAQITGRHRASAEPGSTSPSAGPEPAAPLEAATRLSTTSPQPGAPAEPSASTAIPLPQAPPTRDIGYGMVPVAGQAPAIAVDTATVAAAGGAQAEPPFSFSLSPRTQQTRPRGAGHRAAGHLPGSASTPSTRTGSVPAQPASTLSAMGPPPTSSPVSAVSAQTGSWSEPLTAPLSTSPSAPGPGAAPPTSDPLSAPLTAPLSARPTQPLPTDPLSAPLSAPSAAPLSAASAAPLSAPSAAPLSASSAPTEQWSAPLASPEPQASPAAASPHSPSWQALPPAAGQHTAAQPQAPSQERPAAPEVWEHSDRWPGLRPSATTASNPGRPAQMPGMQAPVIPAGPAHPSPTASPASAPSSSPQPAPAHASPISGLQAPTAQPGSAPSAAPTASPGRETLPSQAIRPDQPAHPGLSEQPARTSSAHSTPSASTPSARSAQSAQIGPLHPRGGAPDELRAAFAHAREPGMTGSQPRVPHPSRGSAAPAAPAASAAALIGYPATADQTGPQGVPALPASTPAQQPATDQQRAQSPRPAMAQFLETFETPALLRSRTLGILAANRSGSLLYAPVLQWGGGHGQHVNLLEFALVAGEAARGFWPDWELVVASAISELSLTAEQHPDDAEIISTVGALMTSSRDFGRMWSEATPRRLANEGTETISHPLLGVVELPYRILYMDDDGSHVVVYAPVPGSSAHAAIKRLTR